MPLRCAHTKARASPVHIDTSRSINMRFFHSLLKNTSGSTFLHIYASRAHFHYTTSASAGHLSSESPPEALPDIIYVIFHLYASVHLQSTLPDAYFMPPEHISSRVLFYMLPEALFNLYLSVHLQKCLRCLFHVYMPPEHLYIVTFCHIFTPDTYYSDFYHISNTL